MGLDENFQQVINQILLLDLLLSVNKAYSMVLTFEVQKVVMCSFFENVGLIAFLSEG